MSAWPEAIYIIKKLQKSINELADIDADIARIDTNIATANLNLVGLQNKLDALEAEQEEFDKVMTIIDTNVGTSQAPVPSTSHDVTQYSVFLIQSP